MPLTQVAQIAVKDTQTLVVNVIDEEFTSLVLQSIRNANLGLNPQQSSPSVISVPVPRLSKEGRAALLKNLNQIAEGHRAKIRHERQEGRKDLKKYAQKSKISEDLERRYEKEVMINEGGSGR